MPEGQGDRAGVAARRTAIQALVRVEEGAYANLVLPKLLDESRLAVRDRAFVTDLVYGSTRMRRACDHIVAPFLHRDLDPPVRAALRLGAYQLHFLGTKPHAAVSATAGAVSGPARGLVNAVLRRVADAGPTTWPDAATRLSYPDWIVDLVESDLGADDGLAALSAMNEAAVVHTRPDGYVQDPASQMVAAAVGVQAGERVLDLCAAPGGKATAMAGAAGVVVAGDLRPHRAGLIATNARATGANGVAVVVADGRLPPVRPGAFDRVLVDAPCSGLGVLRRRPDARWRVQRQDVDDLVALQRALLGAAVPLVCPGGTLTYSVCTFTRAETVDQDDWLRTSSPGLEPLPGPEGWRPAGRGGLLLPQDRGTDGMFVLNLRRRPS